MGKIQKVYSKELKEEAVQLVQTSGKPIAQIAREWGISDSAIHGWRKEWGEQGEEAFPGKGHQPALEEENRRLKREVERLQQERDIFKKAVSTFSRESKWDISSLNNTRRNFPSWSCVGSWRSRNVATMRGASDLPASVNEKMLRSHTRFDRPFMTIRADTQVRVSWESCVTMESTAPVSGSPD
jgi:transposase